MTRVYFFFLDIFFVDGIKHFHVLSHCVVKIKTTVFTAPVKNSRNCQLYSQCYQFIGGRFIVKYAGALTIPNEAHKPIVKGMNRAEEVRASVQLYAQQLTCKLPAVILAHIYIPSKEQHHALKVIVGTEHRRKVCRSVGPRRTESVCDYSVLAIENRVKRRACYAAAGADFVYAHSSIALFLEKPHGGFADQSCRFIICHLCSPLRR